jgi:hypothetical protein
MRKGLVSERVGIVAGGGSDLVDLREPGVGHGAAGGRQATGLVDLAGRVVLWCPRGDLNPGTRKISQLVEISMKSFVAGQVICIVWRVREVRKVGEAMVWRPRTETVGRFAPVTGPGPNPTACPL